MEFTVFKTKVFTALKKDSLHEVFETFFSLLNANTECYKELISNSAFYHRIEKAYRQNTITWEVMSQNRSRVITSIIGLIEEVEEQLYNPNNYNFSSNQMSELYYEDNNYLWNKLNIVSNQKGLEKLKEEKNNEVFRLNCNFKVASMTVRGGNENIEYPQEAKEDFTNYMEIRGISSNALSFLIIGDSMSPFLEAGERIICEPYIGGDELSSNNTAKLAQLKAQIKRWEKDNIKKVLTVVVQTWDGGTLVKYIKQIYDDRIILTSENEFYPAEEITLPQIKALWIVKGKINYEEF
jgi:hypothetical protein